MLFYKKKRKILFLINYLGHRGDSLVLLKFLEYFNKDANYKLYFILKGGEKHLINKLKKYGKFCIYKPQKLNIVSFIKNFVKNKNFRLFLVLILKKYDLIISQDIFNKEYIHILKKIHNKKFPKLLFYVHTNYIGLTLYPSIKKLLREKGDYFIAISDYIYTILQKELNIPKEKIVKIYNFPIFELNSSYIKKPLAFKIPNYKIVITSGALNYNKGLDFFIAIAREIVIYRNYPNILFFWIGYDESKDFDNVYMQKFFLIKEKLNKNVFFIRKKKNPIAYYYYSNIVLSLSKEESFSLPTVEALNIGKITLGFKNTGGIEEILSPFPELLSEFGDIKEISDKILFFLTQENNNELKNRLKNYVQKKYNPQLQLKKLNNFLNKLL